MISHDSLVRLASIVDTPLLILTIALSFALGAISVGLFIRHRKEPGEWMLCFLTLVCMYMIISYGMKLFGVEGYNTLGLVEGIVPVDCLLLVGVYYGIFEW